MRVTTLYTQQRREAEIMRGQERLENARQRVSTGIRIEKPSDDPAQISELLRVQSQIGATTNLQAAINAAMPLAKEAEGALADITNGLRQAKTIAIQANNATLSPEQRQVLADQIENILRDIQTAANTQVDGRYVFAGTNSNAEPFTAGPPVAYTGNGTPLQVGVTDGQSFPFTVPGNLIMNARGSTDLFANLTDLEGAIRTGDVPGLTSGMDELDANSTNVVRLRADMGSRINYLDHTNTKLGDNLVAQRQRESVLKDADMAEAILDEKTDEATQQATLAAASNLNQPSLLDYLR